jgi:5-methylcytosine-specific restriction enzyme subunit McrC
VIAIAADVVLSEWDDAVLSGLELTPADRVVSDRLRKLGRLDIVELRDRSVRIESRGWIGVIRLDACTIRVEPALIEGHRHLIELLDAVRRLDLMKSMTADTTFVARDANLFDLMAWLLALACDKVLRTGIHADYVPHFEDLTTLRGRLNVRAQVLRRWGRLDRLACDFEERVRDIPENRWLVRALRVASRAVVAPHVTSLVRRTFRMWEELASDDRTEPLEKPTITRINHHYRHALALAYLVLEGVTTSDVLRAGGAVGFSFMLNMPQLFEEFVACVLERLFEGSETGVERQAVDRSILWDADAHRPFGHLRPDVMLTQGTARLPIDAKYKDYDAKKLQPGDVYQAAIYALTMASRSTGTGLKRCLLLHPAHQHATAVNGRRVQVRIQGVGEAQVERYGLRVGPLLGELRQLRDGPELSTLREFTRVS